LCKQRGNIWIVSPHVRTTHVKDGTTVLLDIEKGVFYKLNATGSRIWLAIDSSPRGMTLEGIVTAAKEQNPDVHYKRLEIDAMSHLEQLEQMELVHRSPHLG
jgi:hypothetical protein